MWPISPSCFPNGSRAALIYEKLVFSLDAAGWAAEVGFTMIGKQSRVLMDNMMRNRIRIPNIEEPDFQKMTRLQSVQINSIKNRLDVFQQAEAPGCAAGSFYL